MGGLDLDVGDDWDHDTDNDESDMLDFPRLKKKKIWRTKCVFETIFIKIYSKISFSWH